MSAGRGAPEVGASGPAGVLPVVPEPTPPVPRRVSRRDLLLRWYLPLLAGLVPVLVVGLGAGAVADRLAFAVWAVVVAGGYAALLRVTYDLGWSGRLIAGAGLGTLSLGSVAFAALVERHQEIFDLGYRVVLPSLYHPVLTRPLAPLLSAAVLAAAAAVLLAVQGAASTKGDTP